MLLFPPFLLRRKRILAKLKECGAFFEESAVTLKEAGVFYPNAFPRVTQNLVHLNRVKTTRDGKYYIKVPECGIGQHER